MNSFPACLFLRGDVSPARRRVELAVSREHIESSSYGALTSEQSSFGLLSGFSISFPWAKRPQGVGAPPKADIVIAPSGEAVVEASEWSSASTDSKKGDFSLASFIPKMKAIGILPASNMSDPENGVFQSETGEIVMRSKENVLKVMTPRSEAVAIEGGRGEALGALTLVNTSTAACIAACSVDGKKLEDSRRIVLVYSTEAANSGMELSTVDGKKAVLIDHGQLPVLLKTGQLNASLKNINGASMSLYALKMNGERGERARCHGSGGKPFVQLGHLAPQSGTDRLFRDSRGMSRFPLAGARFKKNSRILGHRQARRFACMGKSI